MGALEMEGEVVSALVRTAAIVVPWLAWLAYWIHAAPGTKDTVRMERRLSRTLQSIPLIVGSALIVLPLSLFGLARGTSAEPVFGVLQWSGLAVVVAGLLFSVWGRVHLGTNWSVSVTLKDDHELVRSGPYALVRHPIYSGCLAALAGAAMIRGEWFAGLGLVLIFLSLAYKVRLEERWLSEHFGEPYRAYRRQVRALVPGLY
ncbi:methyltransferase family protein (plasmid) [Ralstonia sp. 25C]|uniref:methyltransferase family protein n=1 Tax=Ralstonia sp. 25C TaxID=3447363 RepID=UPI003F756D9A